MINWYNRKIKRIKVGIRLVLLAMNLSYASYFPVDSFGDGGSDDDVYDVDGYILRPIVGCC